MGVTTSARSRGLPRHSSGSAENRIPADASPDGVLLPESLVGSEDGLAPAACTTASPLEGTTANSGPQPAHKTTAKLAHNERWELMLHLARRLLNRRHPSKMRRCPVDARATGYARRDLSRRCRR